ncbi:MAG: F0F1 ATP synthase subunit A, partial [Bacteroidota bacterium]
MQVRTFRGFFSILFLLVFSISFASSASSGSEDKPFNTKELIFHHITDSHGFHVAGDFSVPLPVILWTKNGL